MPPSGTVELGMSRATTTTGVGVIAICQRLEGCYFKVNHHKWCRKSKSLECRDRQCNKYRSPGSGFLFPLVNVLLGLWELFRSERRTEECSIRFCGPVQRKVPVHIPRPLSCSFQFGSVRIQTEVSSRLRQTDGRCSTQQQQQQSPRNPRALGQDHA